MLLSLESMLLSLESMSLHRAIKLTRFLAATWTTDVPLQHSVSVVLLAL